jgi:hypothetical protein
VLCGLTLDMLALFYIIIILVQRVVLTFCTTCVTFKYSVLQLLFQKQMLTTRGKSQSPFPKASSTHSMSRWLLLKEL